MASNTTASSSRRSLTPATPRRWKHQNLAGAVAVVLHNSDHKKHTCNSSPMNFRQSLMKSEISARKLAAGLWQLWFLEVSEDGGAYTNDGSFPSFKMINGNQHDQNSEEEEEEEATKWNPTLNEGDSIVTVLLEELLRAKNSINKLKAAHKSSKKKAKQLLQTLENKLTRERRSRERMEIVNEKLVNELAAANESAKKFMINYETEKREREITEEVCDELAQLLGEGKAKVEVVMLEIEEEREMMRMSEQFREERVQMKLSDAKDLVEDKYNQMVHFISYLQTLLRSKGGEDSQLEEAVESVNIERIVEFFYGLSKSLNEDLRKYDESYHPTLTCPLSTIIHIENVDEEGLKFNENYMSYQSSGLGRINNHQFCHVEDKFSMEAEDRETCVINVNQLRSCPNDETTTIPDTRYSQHRFIQGEGLMKKLKEVKNSIEGGVGTSNSSTNIMNPHITRGMRGCVEWPRKVPITNSKAIPLEEIVKSQKSQLQHILKSKPSC